ncbi:MAG: RsmD family RNA methyltransferase [Hyphomonadaceae bacterium]
MASEIVRTSIFNALQHAAWARGCAGRRVLDLFAGSGAFGFEALARGATFALFVETDAAARGAIRDTIEARGLFGVTRIHRRNAADLGVKPAGLSDPFDLVFIDVTAGVNFDELALARLGNGGWITDDATIVMIGTAAAPAGFRLLASEPDVTFLTPR